MLSCRVSGVAAVRPREGQGSGREHPQDHHASSTMPAQVQVVNTVAKLSKPVHLRRAALYGDHALMSYGVPGSQHQICPGTAFGQFPAAADDQYTHVTAVNYRIVEATGEDKRCRIDRERWGKGCPKVRATSLLAF